MNDEKINFNLCIDIDTLFDTRLPILYALDDKCMTTALSSKSYFNRVKDEFGNIPTSVFKGFYKNRDKRTLLISQPTKMFDLYIEYVINSVTSMTSIGSDDTLKVYLNTYPYDLLDEEYAIISNLVSDASDRIEVVQVNWKNSEIKPIWLRDNVGVIIKYDMLDWIDYHIGYGSLTKCPLLDIVSMGPHILPGKINSKKVDNDTFGIVLEGINSLIGFSFIKTDFFCIKQDIKI